MKREPISLRMRSSIVSGTIAVVLRQNINPTHSWDESLYHRCDGHRPYVTRASSYSDRNLFRIVHTTSVYFAVETTLSDVRGEGCDISTEDSFQSFVRWTPMPRLGRSPITCEASLVVFRQKSTSNHSWERSLFCGWDDHGQYTMWTP